jgi:uncharacterized protein (TIGR00251 family)
VVLEDLYEIARGDGAAKEPPDVLLRVHVQPAAGKTQIMGRHGDALKVKVGAPPEAGRANDAVIALLADVVGVAAAAVTVESGATSRDKRLRIADVTVEDLDKLLELAIEAGGNAAGGNGRGRRGVTR